MKGASRGIAWYVASVLAALAAANCQSILGIHGGTLVDDGGREPGSGGMPGTGGMMVGPNDTGGRAGTAGAGAGGSTGGGPLVDAGAGGTGAKDASAYDVSGPDNEDGASPDQRQDMAPRTDGGADQIATTPDGGSCVAPWSMSGVHAQLLNVDSATATACSFSAAELPPLAAGLDRTSFRASGACGACLRVQLAGSSNAVVVSVVELSGATGILLSRGAMDQLSPGASQATVDWTLVACDVGATPVSYRIKDGTNPGYLGVQIRNARYPLSSAAVVGPSGTIPLTLRSYNFWESSAAGAGPVTFRLTDVNGQTFDDSGIKLTPNTDVVGQRQFPVCH